MRKIFTFIALLCAGTMMASVKIGDLYYELYDATSTAAVTYEKYAGEFDKNYPTLTDVVIPSTVTYSSKEYTVTTIDEWAFSYANHIKTIQLPSTITTIGAHAFKNDTALTEITIPEGVTVLKEGVLSRTYALTSVKLPSTIEKIERQAFMSAIKLETITLPAKVSMIYQEAFYYCQSLKSIIYKGTSSPSVGTDAFKYTPSEFTFYVPCGTIPTFTGITTNIKDTMVYDIDVIAEHADVKIDTAECKNITISLENIDPAYVFLGWAHGETETSFDTVVIRDVNFTANFRKIPAVGDTIQYEYKGNNLYYMITYKNSTLKEVTIVNDGTSAMAWTESNKPTGALVIPDSIEDWQGTKYAVAYMYSNVFRGCSGITSVDFSENTGIQIVPFCAFHSCTALESVTLSDAITNLMGYCFCNCPLNAIDLKNVSHIDGPDNFTGSNITEVHIPESWGNMPNQTHLFDHATSITCDPNNPYFVAIDNVLYDKDVTKVYGLPIGLTDVEIHIPATVNEMLYRSMYKFQGTLYINSQITPDYPATLGDDSNSPKGDVIVGCGLLGFYTTGRFEGESGDFATIKSISEQLLWNVDVHAATHGSVAIIDTTECNQVHITATPDEGYVFNSWSNDLKTAEITLNVDRDTTITAYFNKLITNVELSISQLPKLNETRGENSFAASVAEDADYEIKDWRFIDDADLWTGDPTDIFTPGLYAVNVCIKPKSGFVFPVTDLNIADVSKITATVNGETPDQVHGGWEGVPVLYLSTDFTISDATGIEQITNDKSQTTKIIKDNQLFILRGDKVYTITGQKVK